jgi:two-component system, chemotaxis family, sensor kinase CheA
VLPGCAAAMADVDPLQVVVYSGPGRRIGLVVERILDIVEAVLDLDPSTRAPGLLGAAIIDRRLTDVLDVPGLLALADPVFAQPHAPELQEA